VPIGLGDREGTVTGPGADRLGAADDDRRWRAPATAAANAEHRERGTGGPPIYRLVLWNIDLTLVDVARVWRDACADAFARVTGQPLVALPQTAGRTDSEIFFEAMALNQVSVPGPAEVTGQELLARYTRELAAAFDARRELLPAQGRALPGARDAVAAVAGLPGVIQSVLTGTIRPNAVTKLRAFGLDEFFDLEIGGYGSEVYPKGAQLVQSRGRAAEKYRGKIVSVVYVAD
jgi:phosphoglycolate phosphatase